MKANGQQKGAALFETMAQQVALECDRTVGEARREAEAIVADASRRADDARRAALAATDAEMHLLDSRMRQKGSAEAAKAGLAVKNEGVERVLALVRQQLRDLASGPDFGRVLDPLLEELMKAASADNIVVLAPERHVDHVRQWLSTHGYGRVSVESSRALWDGVAVQDPGRTYRISNTLSGRFNRVQEKARRVCMTKLFDSGAA